MFTDDSLHDVPFQRRVTNTLVEALTAAARAARQVLVNPEDLSPFDDAVEGGVSANLCGAIARMGPEDSPSSVHVTVDWAATLRRDREAESAVALEPAIIPVFGQASDFLKRNGPFDDSTILG